MPQGGCLFCQIAAGDLDAEIVFSDDLSLAFLDIRPLFQGHCLLVPREHHETITDLPAEQVGPFFTNVQTLAGVVRDAMGAAGTFVAMNNNVSQSVPHLHVHIVPRNPKDGLRGFFWPRTRYADRDQMRSVGDSIRSEMAKL